MKFSRSAGIGLALTGCLYASMAHDNNQHNVRIIGDETCEEKTTNALDLLEEKAPEYYEMVTENIGAIQCATQGSGLRINANPVSYVAGMQTINAGDIWYASTIAHDSCHALLYNEYREKHGLPVPDETWTGKKAEINCLYLQMDALEKMDADEWAMRHMSDMIHFAYWDVPLEQRWW